WLGVLSADVCAVVLSADLGDAPDLVRAGHDTVWIRRPRSGLDPVGRRRYTLAVGCGTQVGYTGAPSHHVPAGWISCPVSGDPPPDADPQCHDLAVSAPQTCGHPGSVRRMMD